MNNTYNCNLYMYIKGTFAGSFECPFYAGLTVVKTSLATSKPKGQNRLARFVYGNSLRGRKQNCLST
jgi:hypothetical protein